jgi:hypothetical protein
MKNNNIIIITAVVGAGVFFLLGGMDKLKGLFGQNHANSAFPFTDKLMDGNVQGFTSDLESYIQNMIRQAGGDPNGSFQNLSTHRNINRGGGGNINQSFSQEQDS